MIVVASALALVEPEIQFRALATLHLDLGLMKDKLMTEEAAKCKPYVKKHREYQDLEMLCLAVLI